MSARSRHKQLHYTAGRHDEKHERARLLLLRGDHFGARLIVEAILKADASDNRAKRLLKQIEEAESGSGRTASWRQKAPRRGIQWRRALHYALPWCRRSLGRARTALVQAGRVIGGWAACGRQWIARREWRNLRLRDRVDQGARRFRRWLSSLDWREFDLRDVDWLGPIVYWLTKVERPSRGEYFSVAVLGALAAANLAFWISAGVQKGWMAHVTVPTRHGYATYTVWFAACGSALFAWIVLLYGIRGLLKTGHP